MRLARLLIQVLVYWLAISFVQSVSASDRLRMATTTSTDNSGLLRELNPVFEQTYNARVDVITVGTGQALKLAENGDVDIVFVHDPDLEQAFVDAGFGVDRRYVMYNDFIIIGPSGDPARVREAGSAADAFSKIAGTGAIFISRGDNSGTHQKEKRIWREAGIEPRGAWYLAVGQGMGVVLQIAHEREAYALADRATFMAYAGRIELDILLEGGWALRNPYHIIAVNPERHPHVRYDLARKYIDFITGVSGQAIIRDFEINSNRLFFLPN